MKPLYVALIVIGCLILVAAAVTIPIVVLILTNKTNSSPVSPVVTPTPTTTGIIPVPPITPLPPPPPKPTKLFPQYTYMASVDLTRLHGITVYVLDTFADPPVFTNSTNPVLLPGTTDVVKSYVSPDDKRLYILTSISLLVCDLTYPLQPSLLSTLNFVDLQIPALTNAVDLVITPDNSWIFISASGTPPTTTGGLLVLSVSGLVKLSWIPSASAMDTFYSPRFMAMNSNGKVLYIANGTDGSIQNSITMAVFFIDNNTISYHSTVIVGSGGSFCGLSGLVIDPASTYLYATAFCGLTTYKIDTTTFVSTASDSTVVGVGSPFLNFSATLALAGDSGGDMSAFNITGDEPVLLPRGPTIGASFPTGVANDKYMFASSASGQVYYARIDTNPLFQNFTVIYAIPGTRNLSPQFSQLLIVI